MVRKKKSQQAPRRKRMTRDGRLSAAKATRWVDQYKEKDVVAGYANWFGVDLPCAVMELRLLGVTIDADRESQIKATIEARAAARKRRQELRAQAEPEQLPLDSDETFAFIARYRSGGAPYGITFEELGGEPLYLGDEDDPVAWLELDEQERLDSSRAPSSTHLNRFAKSHAPRNDSCGC